MVKRGEATEIGLLGLEPTSPFSAHRSPQLPQAKVTSAQQDQSWGIYSHILFSTRARTLQTEGWKRAHPSELPQTKVSTSAAQLEVLYGKLCAKCTISMSPFQVIFVV